MEARRVARSVKLKNPAVPTGDARHTAKIRDGKQSAEVFCRNNKRREELGLFPIIKDFT